MRKKIKAEVKISKFKLEDSYTSLFIGLIVVVVGAIVIFSFGKNRHIKQTSSVQDGPVNQEKKTDKTEKKTKDQRIYIVKSGDGLWNISESIYNSGHLWVEIAKENNLENPGLIFTGDKLVIPDITPQTKTSVTINNEQKKQLKTSSITGDSYKIVKDDSLWDIAVRAYGDGYRWVDIAKTNDLDNPNLIFSENVLKIPR